MTVYRITEFTASNIEEASKMTEEMRDMLESVGAIFIDVISLGNENGIVIAKYPDKETMNEASEIAKKAFSNLIEAGVIDPTSLSAKTGALINSF